MNILIIDTSTNACVLGLATDEGLYSHTAIVDRSHSKEILPRIDRLLGDQNLTAAALDLIIYGRGPGSFTGLRIGIGITQGLAFGLDIPVIGISVLACLAQKNYRCQGEVNSLVALLARAEEVYFAAYQVVDGVATLSGREQVVDAAAVPRQDKKLSWSGTGTAWHLKSQIEQASGLVLNSIHEAQYPEFEDLLLLGLDQHAAGNFTSAIDARPEYLREVVASVPKK